MVYQDNVFHNFCEHFAPIPQDQCCSRMIFSNFDYRGEGREGKCSPILKNVVSVGGIGVPLSEAQYNVLFGLVPSSVHQRRLHENTYEARC